MERIDGKNGGTPVFLVTGGAGFIGKSLCRALLDRGYRVRCLDDLSGGQGPGPEGLEDMPGFTFIRGDIRDYETCLMAARGVDYVLHQAALGNVPRSIESPRLYQSVNVGGTLNVLEAARAAGVRRLVYASSSSVYGDAPGLPQAEGGEGAPLSPYAATKRACEDYGRLYTRLYGLETIGLRYFNVFGPGQSGGAAVIPRFISRIVGGERPEIYGDGLQSRDFTYIDNVVDANLKACAAPAAAGGVYNIACGTPSTLLQALRALCAALERTAEPVFLPERPGDIRHSLADISRAERALGYVPVVAFEEGIRRTVDWWLNEVAR